MTHKLLERLNPQQRSAVVHIDGPLLVLAGAGSGKTGVLTRRIAWLIHQGVDPESILAVTFTNKAAAEMKERVIDLAGAPGDNVWMSTFHSSCCRILRIEAETLGYTRRFTIWDDDDQIRVLRQIVADLGYDPTIIVPREVLGRIDHYKNRLLTPDDLLRTKRAHLGDALLRIWRAYEDSLKTGDAMDFNDLIGKTVELFEHHPDALAKYQQRFQYVLVDEYQDTNPAQYRMLSALVREHRNLAVVGDDDQSIYGFRGADVSIIRSFTRDFPEAKVVSLEQNYRSTGRILEVANAVVQLNDDRIEKRLWTETEAGPRVEFMLYEHARDEAKGVTRKILNLRRKGVGWSDIAIIYRTNLTSQAFEMALAEQKVPYKVVGGRPFYSRREVRDTLSYLRLISNPADDAAFLRIVNVPPRGIGTATLAALREDAANRGEPLLKTARTLALGSDRIAKAFAGFLQIIDGLIDVVQQVSMPVAVKETLERSGYLDMLRSGPKDEEVRLDSLSQLLKDAASFDPEDPSATSMDHLHAWLDRIALTGGADDEAEDGQVTLMTVHSSKGLEFPNVFVVRMNEGQFPHARSAEDPSGVQEERRLAYVAFTRAQQRLFISRVRTHTPLPSKRPAHWRRTAEDGEPAAPSRFIFGIPADACTGVLPDAEDEPQPTPKPAPPVQKLATFLAHQRASRLRKAAPAPTEGSLRTRCFDANSRPEAGQRVHHDTHGLGTVVRVGRASVQVSFGGVTHRVSFLDEGLQLVDDA